MEVDCTNSAFGLSSAFENNVSYVSESHGTKAELSLFRKDTQQVQKESHWKSLILQRAGCKWKIHQYFGYLHKYYAF